MPVDPTPTPNTAPNTEELADLTAHAAALGLTASDLDETIYEVANAGAADSYNAGALPGRTDDDAYETLHDTADAAASQINNGGLETQLAYLATQWGPVAARAHLDHLAE